MSRTPLVLAWGLLALLPPPARAQEDPGLARLRTEMERLAAISGGTMGVAVVHLESGAQVFVNADEPFPMASTFKVPVAARLLAMADAGALRLDSMITVAEGDIHPGSGEISHLLDDPGVSLSVRNLMELMLLISDNSATDLLLRAAGGGGAVNARLAELGVEGITVDRPTVELIADAIGVKGLPEAHRVTPAVFREANGKVTEAEREAAREAFYLDRRDTATPRGMASLLRAVWEGRALSPGSTELLLDIMYRCETGEARLKGMLPPGTRVAHKTGSLGIGVANDVGIVDLPGNAGHLVVAAFVKESTATPATQERAIAHVARAAHDYFVLRPPSGG